MPDFRLFYVNDGTTMADSIVNKFSGNHYSLVVERHQLQWRHSYTMSESSYSPETPTSPLYLATSPGTLAEPDWTSAQESPKVPAKIAVLIVTRGMMIYLARAHKDERQLLTKLVHLAHVHVALSFQVLETEVKAQLGTTFVDTGLMWNHLEVGASEASFRHCTISLIVMLDNEAMPAPTLKLFYLLPDTPVLAGDRVYIYLEKKSSNNIEATSLDIKFENGSHVTANQIADCLFEFEAPDCPWRSLSLEVFTDNHQSLGKDTLRYSDKFQLLTTMLQDLLEPTEFIYQALRLENVLPQVMGTALTAWSKLQNENSLQSQITIVDWEESLQHGQTSSESIAQELPTPLHTVAKYNLGQLAQSLLKHSWACEALGQKNAEGLIPEKLATKYGHDGLAHQLAAGKKVNKSRPSSYDEPDCLYVEPSEISQFPDMSLDLKISKRERPSHISLVDDSNKHNYIKNRNTKNPVCSPPSNDDNTYCNIKTTSRFAYSRADSSKSQAGFATPFSESDMSGLSGAKQSDPHIPETPPVLPRRGVRKFSLPLTTDEDTNQTKAPSQIAKHKIKAAPRPASEIRKRPSSQKHAEPLGYGRSPVSPSTPTRVVKQLPHSVSLTKLNSDTDEHLSTFSSSPPPPIPCRRPSAPTLSTNTSGSARQNGTPMGDEEGTDSTGYRSSTDSAYSDQHYIEVDDGPYDPDPCSQDESGIYSEVAEITRPRHTPQVTIKRGSGRDTEMTCQRHYKARSSPPGTIKQLPYSTRAKQYPRPSSDPKM